MKRLLSLTVVIVLVASCKKEEQKASLENEIQSVETASVHSMQPSMQVVLPGELKPWNRTSLHPKVKGYVGQTLVDRGTVVKKGQLLAMLEAPEIVAALNQAQAQVSSAEATLIEQTAKKKISKTTFDRVRETSETAGAVSENELDAAYARMLSDSALAQAAGDNLNAAKAQLASQEQLVQYLFVKAPFDGNITERNISPGDLVGPEPNSPPMFVLEDRSRLRLTIAVPENLSNALTTNSVVSFTTQADPLAEYQAHFGRSSNSLLEKNRTMLAEFDYNNADNSLKAGMYAEVKIPVMRNRRTLFVPKTSVLHSTEGVFLVKIRNDIAEWVSIQKGNNADSLVEVFGNVHEGDLIVRHASEELRNGQPLKAK